MLHWLFDASWYAPQGACLLWEPDLIWTLMLGRLGTALGLVMVAACMAVSLTRGRVYPSTTRRLLVTTVLCAGVGQALWLAAIWVPLYHFIAVWMGVTGLAALLTMVSMLWACADADRAEREACHASGSA